MYNSITMKSGHIRNRVYIFPIIRIFFVLLLLLAISFSACIVITEAPNPNTKSASTPPPAIIKPPAIVTFEVNPVKVTSVETVLLRWEVTGADKVIIEPSIGDVPSSGTKNIIPSHSVVYKLTATNAGGSVVRNAEVFVYENINASKIALTEEDVKPYGFIFYQNSEPSIKQTISTYYVVFKRSGLVVDGEEILDVTVSIHNSVVATEDRYIDIKSNARSNIIRIITIGDEGYVMEFPGSNPSEPTKYIIRFRKNNVYVNIGTLPNYNELESLARVIELRIK